MSKTVVSHTEQIGQECTDETSIRLPNRSHNHEPPPPRIRRRTCITYSISPISKMVTRPQAGGGHEFNSFLNVCCSRFRLQLIAICCNRRVVYTVHFIRHFFSCSEHALIVAHHTAWLKCWCTLRLIRIVIHVCDLIVCALPFSSLCSFPCVSPISSST